METVDLKNVSAAELEKLLREKKQQEHQEKMMRRDAYEGIRASTVKKIEDKVTSVSADVAALFDFVKDETTAFYAVMSEYGCLRREGQMSYTLKEGNFMIEVRTNRIKTFDERADVAAERLIDFLRKWIERADGGASNPMYQLAMTLLERNKYGNLDYKSVSKLYDMEDKFNDEVYSDIMTLFKESNVVETTSTNYYFSRRDDMGVWRKVEVSFNRL